ncbi:outer membrane protein assembly factor BamB family protein [Cellulomonas chengniuliangii]|uniref:PQQ-like beta-propeller repeat protein n=1 Tax=Cellulomonas chengniuliangii TaxID=2968084 RepID=A0ABY5KZD8_9CELL|nr:PQQ-binding-like beta-propeller repeat protein [Cellulomonas chengniuliangii]MCC2307324.1 PQQ-like beta-propeller repeat protein [Cellulomonas chengniuliangii]UUI75886.1 PQQ-like beta-propeller repeat protein [Cellulomonas chengniuliangii]
MTGPAKTVRVLLDDGDEPAASKPHGSHEPTDEARRPANLRRWPIAAAAALLLVGGLVAAQGVIDRRERAATERLRDVPGVLLPVDESLRELWQTDLTWLWAPPVRVGTDLVVGQVGPDGSQTVRALRADTGEVLWEAPVAPPEPSPPTSMEWQATPPACQLAAADSLVSCQVWDGYELGAVEWAEPDEPDRPLPTRQRLVVIDPAERAIVVEHELERLGSVVMLDDVFVTATADAQGIVTVRARDVRSAQTRWTRDLAPVPADEGAALDDWATTWGTEAVLSPSPHGLGLSVMAAQGTWMLAADGAVLHAGPPGSRLESLRAGAVTLTDQATGSVVLLGADGSRAPHPGHAVRLTVDDGSAPGRCLMTRGGLIVHDCATGEPLWTLDSYVPTTGVLLDGVLYSSSASWVFAIDIVGEEVLWQWERENGAPSDNALHTDGRALLVPDEPTRSGSFSAPTRVVALSLADGEELWTAPINQEGSGSWLVSVAGMLALLEGAEPERLRLYGS